MKCLELIRIRTIEELKRGIRIKNIALSYRLTATIVFRWTMKYKEEGYRSLKYMKFSEIPKNIEDRDINFL